MTILVGADPELFLRRDGEFHSGHGMIPGNKFEPYPVEDGAVQVDGMALEFNINPARNEKEFLHNINHVLGQLHDMIPAEFDVAIDPVAWFSEDHMKEQPEEAKILGCAPDFDAYQMLPNDLPDQTMRMRTAAGHVHVGFTEGADVDSFGHFTDCAMLAKQLDYFLGIPSIVLESSNKRREMYGKAGCFRPKPYGMEYRTLSNFWLKSDKLMSFVYKQTVEAVEQAAKGVQFDVEYGPDTAQIIINNNDKKAATEFCQRFWSLP